MSAAEVIERSTIDEAELDALEAVVKAGMASFMMVGLALIEIRETRGYRLRGYKTFDAYCNATFGFTGKQGRRLRREVRTAQWAEALTGESLTSTGARELSTILGNDANLLRIRDKLQQRGLTLANAPGAAIASLLPKARYKSHARTGGKDLPALPRAARQAGNDVCPGHGGRPSRYFYREAEGGWLCSVCNTVVKLSVSR